MNVLKWLGRGFLVLLASLSITLWISLTTLQMTLLNREAVFGWLNNSGAYQHVGDSVISLQQQPEEAQSTSLNVTALQQAIGDTLSPEFVKQVAETVLGATYDWLQGKTNTITFSINLEAKRAELQQHLAAALKPQFEALPTCNSNFEGMSALEDLQCLPSGTSANATADNVAKQAVEGSDFLSKPLTPEMIGFDASQYNWLPPIVQLIPSLIVGLPILALLAVAGYILMTSDKLAGSRTIAGRLFFGTLLTALGATAIWYFGSRFQFAQALGEGAQVALLRDVIEPIVHQIMPAIGGWAALLAGSVALITGSAWITMIILQRRKNTAAIPASPPKQPSAEEVAKPEPTPTKPEPPKPAPKKIQ